MSLQRNWQCPSCGGDVVYFLAASETVYRVLEPGGRDPHVCPEDEA